MPDLHEHFLAWAAGRAQLSAQEEADADDYADDWESSADDWESSDDTAVELLRAYADQHLTFSACLADLVAIITEPLFCGMVGPSLTCHEAEAVAAVLRAVGYTVAAETWLYGHSEGDEADDLHFGMTEPAA